MWRVSPDMEKPQEIDKMWDCSFQASNLKD